MSAQEKARDAIYESIARLAADREPDALVKLADAYSKVAFGPQGGAYERHAADHNSMDYRYSADYHNTDHPSDEPRRKPGFGA